LLLQNRHICHPWQKHGCTKSRPLEGTAQASIYQQ
jgi:hypothetical protein